VFCSPKIHTDANKFIQFGQNSLELRLDAGREVFGFTSLLSTELFRNEQVPSVLTLKRSDSWRCEHCLFHDDMHSSQMAYHLHQPTH